MGYLLLIVAVYTGFRVFWNISLTPCTSCVGLHVEEQSVMINASEDDQELWKQPEDLGYRPCLELSWSYWRRRSRTNGYLMVVVSGGLNQQKNQIADGVVVARIQEATLVLPTLHVDLLSFSKTGVNFDGFLIITKSLTTN